MVMVLVLFVGLLTVGRVLMRVWQCKNSNGCVKDRLLFANLSRMAFFGFFLLKFIPLLAATGYIRAATKNFMSLTHLDCSDALTKKVFLWGVATLKEVVAENKKILAIDILQVGVFARCAGVGLRNRNPCHQHQQAASSSSTSSPCRHCHMIIPSTSFTVIVIHSPFTQREGPLMIFSSSPCSSSWSSWRSRPSCGSSAGTVSAVVSVIASIG
jgi:hypothetical protein